MGELPKSIIFKNTNFSNIITFLILNNITRYINSISMKIKMQTSLNNVFFFTRKNRHIRGKIASLFTIAAVRYTQVNYNRRIMYWNDICTLKEEQKRSGCWAYKWRGAWKAFNNLKNANNPAFGCSQAASNITCIFRSPCNNRVHYDIPFLSSESLLFNWSISFWRFVWLSSPSSLSFSFSSINACTTEQHRRKNKINEDTHTHTCSNI